MANEEEVILTREGLEKLEAELKELKGPRRSELAARLKLAISYGDLKENSEYHSAKEDQAFMETRILTLEKMMKYAKVVDSDNVEEGTVGVGSTVLLNDLEFKEKVEYQIVGPTESDAFENKISYESPLGKEILGKRIGTIVHVEAPVGIIKYEILEIK